MIRTFSFSAVPPSVNAQKAAVGGRLIKTREYRDWIAGALAEVSGQPGLPPGAFFWSSRIFFPCNHSKVDIDNVPKATHDLLVKAGKVPDDRYLVTSSIRWYDGHDLSVAVWHEPFEVWGRVKKLSPALAKKLGAE